MEKLMRLAPSLFAETFKFTIGDDVIVIKRLSHGVMKQARHERFEELSELRDKYKERMDAASDAKGESGDADNTDDEKLSPEDAYYAEHVGSTSVEFIVNNGLVTINGNGAASGRWYDELSEHGSAVMHEKIIEASVAPFDPSKHSSA